MALQGAVEPHEKHLSQLGVETVRVRKEDHLKGLHGMILPGGESTTMLHLLELNQLFQPLQRFVMEYPTWGICAGAILLAKRVRAPEQKSLNVLDITIERNSYGRQKDSFISPIESHDPTLDKFEAVFIRAPRILELGPKVEVRALWKGEVVCVEQNHLLCTTFHPELTVSTRFHEYFLKKLQ